MQNIANTCVNDVLKLNIYYFKYFNVLRDWESGTCMFVLIIQCQVVYLVKMNEMKNYYI